MPPRRPAWISSPARFCQHSGDPDRRTRHGTADRYGKFIGYTRQVVPSRSAGVGIGVSELRRFGDERNKEEIVVVRENNLCTRNGKAFAVPLRIRNPQPPKL